MQKFSLQSSKSTIATRTTTIVKVNNNNNSNNNNNDIHLDNTLLELALPWLLRLSLVSSVAHGASPPEVMLRLFCFWIRFCLCICLCIRTLVINSLFFNKYVSSSSILFILMIMIIIHLYNNVMLVLLPGDCGGHVTVILGLAANEKLPLLS